MGRTSFTYAAISYKFLKCFFKQSESALFRGRTIDRRRNTRRWCRFIGRNGCVVGWRTGLADGLFSRCSNTLAHYLF